VQPVLGFRYIILHMLDLSFVRDNLPKIEEMLRNRGMDPHIVLKDFHEVDAQRRQAINSAETLRAERADKRHARTNPGSGEGGGRV